MWCCRTSRSSISPTRAAALGNLYRWLRPGGTLVITTVNRRHPFVAAYLGIPDGRSPTHPAADQGDRRGCPSPRRGMQRSGAVTAALAARASRRSSSRPSATRPGMGPPAADVRPGAGRRPDRAGQPEPPIHDPRGRAEARRLTALFTFGAEFTIPLRCDFPASTAWGRPDHHQPPGGRRDPGSHVSPSTPTRAANRHQRRFASFPFSSREMTDWSSPHSFPRWRWLSPARRLASRTDSPMAAMPARDTLGKSIEPRPAFGNERGVYMAHSYMTALHLASSADCLPATPPSDAGKLHQKCREVASRGEGDFPARASRLKLPGAFGPLVLASV